MTDTIDQAASAAGWEGITDIPTFIRLLADDLKDKQRALERLREAESAHEAQERRLKIELAESRAETAKIRRVYQQQHDVWEELYVKEGIERLRARAEAYDGVQEQLELLLKAVDTAGNQRPRALEIKNNTQRVELLQRILLSVVEAAGACRTKRLERAVGERIFAQRLSFANESVNQSLSTIDLQRLLRDSRALETLITGLCSTRVDPETASAARQAFRVLVEGK